MDSSPPSRRSESRSRTKSASRLSRMRETDRTLLTIDLFPSVSPKRSPPSAPKSSESLLVRDLILLSPSLAVPSKTSSTDKLEIVDDASPNSNRIKARASQMGLVEYCSTRKARRNKISAEDLEASEELMKPRKRRHSGRSKKNKRSLTPSLPYKIPMQKCGAEEMSSMYNRLCQLVIDLIMWNDVARSSLWFGFGCLYFLSSCFSTELTFSAFSAFSQLGLLFLAISFFSNSYRQRECSDKQDEFKIKEEDILKIGRYLLPPINVTISKVRDLFSGEPSMTLKVAPILLIGAEYGHFLTLWRLCLSVFFLSFTVPKLYTTYAPQIIKQVETLKTRMMSIWKNCSHKKIVAVSAAAAFWNLSSARTRAFAVFVSLVVLKKYYHHLPVVVDIENKKGHEDGQGEYKHEQADRTN